MKKTRLISMLCAIAMSLTLVLPVSAANYGGFTYTRNGKTHGLTAEGHNGLENLHFKAPRNYLLGANEKINFVESGGSPFSMTAGERVTITVILASSAPFEVGYRLNDGDYQRIQRNGTPSETHTATLTIPESGNYKFVMYNCGSVGVTITNIYVDITGV